MGTIAQGAEDSVAYDAQVRRRHSPFSTSTIRLWTPVVAISLICVLVALAVWVRIGGTATPEERVARLVRLGELESAERLSWRILEANPSDLEAWIRFIDLHATVRYITISPDFADAGFHGPSASDSSIRALLARISDPQAATIATYWYESRAVSPKHDPAVVIALADAPRPARFANDLLGRAAARNDEWLEAARRFEREGLAFPNHAEPYLRRAIAIWIDQGEWNEVRRRLDDPSYARVIGAAHRLELATHDRDWPEILLRLWPASFTGVSPWPVALALVAAALWFTIAARLGRIHDREPGRALLYAGAFLLGVASIYPTLILITVQESIFNFRLLGHPLPDAIYFIFGVGLREELCKLLMFLPLLPLLKRRGSRLEAMTCGAFVGLGFAAEENVAYFQQMNAAAALARFVTANFLHMALTSLVALSLYDTVRRRAGQRDRFDVVFPLVVVVHGLYDLFLASEPLAEYSFVAMILLIVVTQQFLRHLLVASSAMETEAVLRLVAASLALLTGVSYIYATTLVGPLIALRLIALAFLGAAIMIYAFVRELGGV